MMDGRQNDDAIRTKKSNKTKMKDDRRADDYDDGTRQEALTNLTLITSVTIVHFIERKIFIQHESESSDSCRHFASFQ